jgi:hypothetical protein
VAWCSQWLIWFYSLRLNVARAISLQGCRWVDVGPSSAAHIRELKVKFGFTVSTWLWVVRSGRSLFFGRDMIIILYNPLCATKKI